MATTVNNAFETFMKDYVRIDSERNKVAKASKNNLISEIEKFPDDGKFLDLYSNNTRLDYGSYYRKTKIRPLDDIDIMIILHANGNWREPTSTGFLIRVPETATKQLALCDTNTNILNSIKVINKFKEYLGKVSSYKKAEIKRNQEAVTLELNSYEWVYDIVPSFKTMPDDSGKTFFLIPDGSGNWKPTDPRIDKERTSNINNKQKISVLDVIRIMKYWTKRRTATTMGSYFLECLILNYYDSNDVTSSNYIDVELPKIFAYIYHNIHNNLIDPKGFQGNLNSLSFTERNSVQERAKRDYHLANDARKFESEGKQKEAIEKWLEIFGSEFPKYNL
ncbi:nucleotidyltransferase [Chryseobacterium oncorhynchi]|uniref:Nucleotidyltransferase n=1 Tax=Chryseobacterium oncorhynchi TaxID=741074 RepID=A0A316X1W1_9FLAO|nr:nucleotidyltransferase [Chryseobacterium oncorhynchi]PWN67675.1 nucleotidyltransferase [Chryseobacterium oncorhynchi]